MINGHQNSLIKTYPVSSFKKIILDSPICKKNQQSQRRKNMTKQEHENWIINIENTCSTICTQIGSATVVSVFQRYGASNIEDLNTGDLPDVFDELYAIEADLR